MPPSRPSPLFFAPSPPPKPVFRTDFLSPDPTYPPSSRSGRLNSLVLKARRSADLLRPSPRAPSPSPSPLLSPSLFPLPPRRNDENKENEGGRSSVISRTPRSSKHNYLLHPPASPRLAPLSPTFPTSPSSTARSLHPESQDPIPSVAKTRSHRRLALVFPHRPRARPRSTFVNGSFGVSPTKPLPPSPCTNVFPSGRQSSAPYPQLPAPPPPRTPPRTPPRKPTRRAPSPPASDRSKRSGVLFDSTLPLTPPGSPTRSIDSGTSASPTGQLSFPLPPATPRSKRIFTSFPTANHHIAAIHYFPHGPTRIRTPPLLAPATSSSTVSTSSSSDTLYSAPPPSPTSSISSCDSDLSHYPTTPPDLFLLVPKPPPRPPRSPLRPTSRPLSRRLDLPSPPTTPRRISQQYSPNSLPPPRSPLPPLPDSPSPISRAGTAPGSLSPGDRLEGSYVQQGFEAGSSDEEAEDIEEGKVSGYEDFDEELVLQMLERTLWR